MVAFGRGSVPELIEDGVTGFIVGSAKEMADLIRPGGEIERLDRRKIREVAVRRFGRDRMVTEYEVLYGPRQWRDRCPLLPSATQRCMRPPRFDGRGGRLPGD